MLQYLIILLDDTCTSYCHYENPSRQSRLISLSDLNAGIFFAMKENLMIQFVYPEEKLPQEYKEAIKSIDHNTIVPSICEDKELLANADIVVFHEWTGLDYFAFNKSQTYVLRTSKEDFFDRYIRIKNVLPKVRRFNIVFTDIEQFTDKDIQKYKDILGYLSTEIQELVLKGEEVQFNLLTDRLYLPKMNNCNAGCENITLAPDGNFYVCPAFYYGKEAAVGNINSGLAVNNPQLYRIDYAPICRHCDAYQCKRCIWLNKKTTMEVNTPSHEQCVIAHLERNASRKMLQNQPFREMLHNPQSIEEIEYLDPFEVREKWDYELLQQELIRFHNENY